MIQSSIIIPVHNKWELTRACLKSLAAGTNTARIEIIVVDNASHDLTHTECAEFGSGLFGASFRYIRNGENRNFAGASNQGARAANGEFLVFLNNDTEVQPGWLEPLISDFAAYPNIGATGPVLLYPGQTPLGRLVQHLGILVTPFLSYGHLHEGIPASSPLARKRRFFQAITGACLVMRKKLFLEAGAFDEGFINGFEDVDLCSRLWQKGLRMTVNPASVVLHHESMTPGRRDHETENSERLLEKGPNLIFPDWHIHLKNDGLDLNVTPWLLLQPTESPTAIKRLDAMALKADAQGLGQLLTTHPYWFNGWRLLIEKTPDPDARAQLFKIWFRLFKTPSLAREAVKIGVSSADKELEEAGMGAIMSCAETPEAARHKLEEFEKWCRTLDMRELACQYKDKIIHFKDYAERKYFPLSRDFLEIAHDQEITLDSRDAYAYALWLHGQPAAPKPENEPEIPLVMPVLNPQENHLKSALNALLAQTHANWKLYVIIDSGANKNAKNVIAEYMARDSRIRHFPESAPRGSWIIFIDNEAELAPDALRLLVNAIAANPRAAFFYSDHDCRDDEGNLFAPCFNKARWDWELLPALNFVGSAAAFRTDRLRAANAMNRESFLRGMHELVLRCTIDAGSHELAHIPAILHHCPATQPNGEPAWLAGSCDMPASMVQAWLNVRSPGAVATIEQSTGRLLIKYPLPAEKPPVNLILSGPGNFDAGLETAWPHEITCVPDGAIEELNAAGRRASGEILGFLPISVKADSSLWLENLARNAIRDDVGAVGGAVRSMGDLMAHGGYLVDASGLPQPLFAGAKNTDWRSWTGFARTVDALDGLCLFTRKDVFLAAGGFNPAMGSWAMQDYCLRLGLRGLRTIWSPFTRLAITSHTLPPPGKTFISAWKNRLPPFSHNALVAKDGFAMRIKPETQT